MEARGRGTGPPISTGSLALFITHLDMAGYAASTISTYVSSISFVHKLAGCTDPANTFLIRKLLEALPKAAPSHLPRLPITMELLVSLQQAINWLYSTYDRALLQSVFSLAFHLCARIGEPTVSNNNTTNVLYCDQLSITRYHGKVTKLTVSFRNYKHKEPRSQVLCVIQPVSGQYCHIKYLAEYLEVRPKITGMFFVKRDGRPLHSSEVSAALDRCLLYLGRDSSRYSTHSFRSGGATEAAIQGASDAQLHMLGRWKSNAFLSYVRPLSFSFKS